MLYLALLGILAGAAISAQAGLNSHLGQLLSSPLLASIVAFITSAIYIILTSLLFVRTAPATETLQSVPFYLWFSGGLFSAFAVATFYYLVPKIGIASMLSFALSGQLVFGVIAAHFGWFHLPVSSISMTKIAGIIAMILGIFLINKG